MKKIELIEQKSIFLKNFFLLIFFYILFEGAVRKWFLPNLILEITLLRDCIVIYGILYSFKNGIYDKSNWQENVIFFWTILVVVWAFVQFLIYQNNYKIYLVGFRGWVLYFWFALMFLNAFNKDTLDLISKTILLSIIPIGLLSIVQHFLPITHALNVQSGLEAFPGEGIFTVTSGIPRTTGTFTFVSGFTEYMKFITPFFVYFIDGAYKNNLSKKIKVTLILIFFLTCLTSGSRTTIMFASIIMFCYFLYVAKNSKEKRIATYIFWTLGLGIVGLVFFKTAIDATFERFVTAASGENSYYRIFVTIFGTSEAWEKFTFLGKGIGAGSNLSQSYVGNQVFSLGEFESTRNLREGGALGLLFLLFKVFFSIIILLKSYKISKSSNNILPFFFSLYVAQQVLMASTTSNLSSHAFTFLGLGFLFSILSVDFKESK
jgi:hypothetical protein|tara:strand:+ start:1765 stop:3063 length:1299 start_codon:yes stop_codon:yes gene_type:complete